MDRLALLSSYIKENPSDPFLHFALAKELEKLERWQEAQEKYLYLTKAHPNYVGTYYHLGKIYQREGFLQEAERVYRRGIETAQRAHDHHSKRELQAALESLDN